MLISKQGENLIKNFESCSLHPYHGAADREGLMTIGWGHLITAGESFTVLTQQEADDLFRKDIRVYSDPIAEMLTRANVDISQDKFDAMVSLCYNIGVSNLKASNVLKYTILKDYKTAALGFKSFIKAAGKVVLGLKRRRAVEKIFYETGYMAYKEVFNGTYDVDKVLGTVS